LTAKIGRLQWLTAQVVGDKEDDMGSLFTTDIGLLSLFTIVFVIGMAGYLFVYARGKMREEERGKR
jgi:hypothetical protein